MDRGRVATIGAAERLDQAAPWDRMDVDLLHNPRVIAGTLEGFEGLGRFRSPFLDPLRTMLPVAVEVENVPAAERATWADRIRVRGFLVDDADRRPDRLRIAGPADRFAWLLETEVDEAPDLVRLLRCAAQAVAHRFLDEFEVVGPRGALPLPRRPRIMAVLNVTPDSFSDGGAYAHPDRAIERALAMAEEGADVLDIGAESTRPGAAPVSVEDEIHRLDPILRALAPRLSIPISLDTRKAEVADRFLGLGVSIVNDVSGLEFDPRMVEVISRHRAAVVINHMVGTPRTMQESPRYDDCVADICRSLRERLGRAQRGGIPRDRVILDPGIGFGKRVEDNLDLLARIGELRSIGLPVLLGCSRKSFLGELTGRPATERGAATAATTALAALRGVRMVRVHDVRETADVLSVLEAIDGRLRE